VDQLGREPGGRPERTDPLPLGRPLTGLLLQFTGCREIRVLDLAGRLVYVTGTGRDLEQGLPGGRPELADEQDPIVGVDGDDRHGAGMGHDLALVA
jgi:hypothetical protein